MGFSISTYVTMFWPSILSGNKVNIHVFGHSVTQYVFNTMYTFKIMMHFLELFAKFPEWRCADPRNDLQDFFPLTPDFYKKILRLVCDFYTHTHTHISCTSLTLAWPGIVCTCLASMYV